MKSGMKHLNGLKIQMISSPWPLDYRKKIIFRKIRGFQGRENKPAEDPPPRLLGRLPENPLSYFSDEKNNKKKDNLKTQSDFFKYQHMGHIILETVNYGSRMSKKWKWLSFFFLSNVLKFRCLYPSKIAIFLSLF